MFAFEDKNNDEMLYFGGAELSCKNVLTVNLALAIRNTSVVPNCQNMYD